MSMSVYVRGFYFPISFVKVLFLLYVFFKTNIYMGLIAFMAEREDNVMGEEQTH